MILSNDQVNTMAECMVRSGCVRDTPSRQALLVRIGWEPGVRQCDGVDPETFALLLVNDVGSREDREALRRLLHLMQKDMPFDPDISALQQATGGRSGPALGLLALSRLLEDPRVRDEAREFKLVFAATCSRIGPVIEYKLIHDQLHQLEFNCHNRIRNNLMRFADANDDSASQEMANCQTELETIVRTLRGLTSSPLFARINTAWVGDLETASLNLQSAIDNQEAAAIQKVLGRTGRVLDRKPDEINKYLVEAARQLRLRDLVDALEKLHFRLRDLGVDPVRAEELQKGVGQLSALDSKLERLIRVHTIWQDIDVELRPIESLLADRIAAGDFSWWDNLKELTRNLEESAPAAFHDLEQKVDGAIQHQKAIDIRDSFRRLQRQLKVGFREADEALRRQCIELPSVLQPLPALAEVLK